ncbi:MAG TPA: TonB-dependent receptor, partial [Bryobacteraceae bacterium]|nr:TonB-dependent receptor [Bryobacteraceae bacterium]
SPSPQISGDTISVRGGDLLARWNHTLSGGSDMSLQMYVDQYRRVDFGAPETHRAFDLDFQHHVALGSRHDIVWGFGYRSTNSGLKSADLSFVPSSRTDGLYSTFIQDEIRITNTLWLTVGSKFEHNPYSGFEYEPGASLAWTPSKKHTIWLSAAKAIRQTSLLNASIDATLSTIPLPNGLIQKLTLFGNPQFKSEQVRDYEAGYRAQLTKRVSLDVALFGSFYRHLETFDPGPVPPFFNPSMQLVVPATYGNKAHATNFGGEMSTTWQVNSRWRLSPGYSFIQMRVERNPGSQDLFPAEPGGDAPKHMLQVRSEFNLAKNIDFDNALYYSARLPSTGAPSRARFDSRIAWRAGESLEFSVVGQNLLRPRTLEFGDAFAVVGTETERSVFGKITWRF